ncbi:MAG TPA: cyclase family protein [Dehalococcoidia bacterium]|nr:cyclase family protein [Dehalococcoidia bacterium]
MLILDLTLPLSHTDVPYTDASGYADPPTRVEPWVAIGQQHGALTSPFHVSHLHLSAHAGTHLDAPSHFHAGAPTVSDIPTGALAGRAVVIDLRSAESDVVAPLRRARDRASASDVTPLLLTPPRWLTPQAVDEVIAWNRPLIAFAGEEDSDPGFVAVSRLLAAGRWIATNLDPAKATQVQDGDLLVVAPLAIAGLEGSPCRVLAIRT